MPRFTEIIEHLSHIIIFTCSEKSPWRNEVTYRRKLCNTPPQRDVSTPSWLVSLSCGRRLFKQPLMCASTRAENPLEDGISGGAGVTQENFKWLTACTLVVSLKEVRPQWANVALLIWINRGRSYQATNMSLVKASEACKVKEGRVLWALIVAFLFY